MKTLIYGIGVVFLAAVLVAVIGLVVALPVMLLWNAVVPAVFSLNIPPCGYRESGKTETAVPAKWKPAISPL